MSNQCVSVIKTSGLVKLGFFVVWLICLAGCSRSGFINWLPSSSTPAPGVISITAGEWSALQQQSTPALFQSCQFTETAHSNKANIFLLGCSHLLLSREDVTLSQQSFARQTYNQQLLLLLRQVLTSRAQAQSLTPRVSIVLEVDRDENQQPFTQFLLADDIQAAEPRLAVVTQAGLGVAAVGRRKNTATKQDVYYPAEGIFRAFTFTVKQLEVMSTDLSMQLILHGKLMNRATGLTLGAHRYPLTYSPGSAYLVLLDQANIDELEWEGLFDASEAEPRFGIFAIEPIVNHKIPILMIHGLNSSPLIWRYLSMALLNFPTLHEKFQIWHAFYPSGPPPFYNAMRLRRHLTKLRNELAVDSVAKDELVVIGHSMGGVIAKTLAVNTEFQLWDSTFVERPDKVLSRIDNSQDIRDIFIFSAQHGVKQVFFIDTPHQGSLVAKSLVGKIGAAMVTLPGNFVGLFQRLINKISIHQVTPEMQPFLENYGPNSIEVLGPGHPLMLALNQLPIMARAFSVIGSQGRVNCPAPVDCAQVSDGVVPYSSAHIQAVDDELLVPSSHDSYQHPQTITFVMEKLIALP